MAHASMHVGICMLAFFFESQQVHMYVYTDIYIYISEANLLYACAYKYTVVTVCVVPGPTWLTKLLLDPSVS